MYINYDIEIWKKYNIKLFLTSGTYVSMFLSSIRIVQNVPGYLLIFVKKMSYLKLFEESINLMRFVTTSIR